MKIYNTLTRQIEEFIPNNPDIVKMYTCGPTVYHFAHIGNLRNYIFEDILEKSLNYLGYHVLRCMNITDVGHLTSDSDSGDDKMLKGAKREHKTVLEIAEYYTEEFKKDTETLNIKWPEIVSKATDNISEYIKIIESLIEKEFAYVSGGNVYFDTSRLLDYYKLTNHQIDEMVVGIRESVEKDDSKKNQADFVLWFTKSKFDEQELKWPSPWGSGYPGWHIECSGISLKYLGENLDIHCGGVDNIFPHHTNEIAQTESYLGHKWCNYWVHGEHLNDASGKMSKSNGEFLTLDLLKEKNYDPMAYRYMCLSTNYRKIIVFTFEALDNATISYKKLKNKISNLKPLGELNKIEFEKQDQLFKDCLSDNLNLPNALTLLYDVLKSEINEITKIELIKKWENVLSLDLLKEQKNDEINTAYIEEMIEKRNLAKKNKNFLEADSIREELLKIGIQLKDTKEKTIYEKI